MPEAFTSSVVANPNAAPLNCSALATSAADNAPSAPASCAPAPESRPAAPPDT